MAMMTRSKWINIICSLIIGLIFGLIILSGSILISGIFSSHNTRLDVYTDSKMKVYDGVALTDHNWNMEGTLKDGHQARAVYKGSRTDVGESENIIELVITDEVGRDVTDDYTIEYHFGKLTVQARQLLIIGDTNGLKDGVLPSTSYHISPDCDGLVIGHNVTVSMAGGIADVKITDSSGKDYTRNYFIILQLDGNTFIPSSGTQNFTLFEVYSDIEDTVYLKFMSYGDYLGQEKWAQAPIYEELIEETFSASYLTSFALEAMGETENTIKIKSLCGYYGLPYYMLNGDYSFQTSDVSYIGSTTEEYAVNYYHYNNAVAPLTKDLADFEKEYGAFVRANYLKIDDTTRAYMEELIARKGFSASDPEVIRKVASFIQNAAIYNLDYPKELETEENVAIAFLETYKEGVCRHYSIAATLLFRALGFPARYTVGVLAFTEAGRWAEVPSDQAHAWVEVYLDGIGWIQVEVTGGGVSEGGSGSGKPEQYLNVRPSITRYSYDGKLHTALQQVTGLEELEEQGYSYAVQISGERKEAGKTVTKIESLQIFDPDGNDVTDQYKLKIENGTLQVYYTKFRFTSKNLEQVYDGRVQDTAPDVYYQESQLKKYGLTVEISVPKDLVWEVGSHLNRFEVRLYQYGMDVTDLYWVDYSFGTVLVTPMEITFKAGDAEKFYDGTELICHSYSITEGFLGEGHTVGDDITYTGSQTMIGRSDNEISYIAIYDKNEKNVTHNYSITLVSGKLKVTR